MRYPAAEKREIIKLVEQSHLSARQTLDHIGIPRATFYRWYAKYQAGGEDELEDRTSAPRRAPSKKSLSNVQQYNEEKESYR